MSSSSSIAICLAIPFFAWTLISPADEKQSGPAKPDFETLETRKGEVFHNCSVSRVEADGLVIKHDGGMARVSLFDLNSSIQARYDFDPIEAMDAYKRDQVAERARRKQILLETEKFKAAQERKAAQEQLYLVAENEWIPCEGTVLSHTSDGIVTDLYQISLVPTTEISTLGFEREGPPKRQLNKFSAGSIFLRHVGQGLAIGDKWRGYVDPAPYQQPLGPKQEKQKHPVHRAVTKR
ncbi:MAG: hypothetical protein HRU46_18135 [Verrucomicrobiales bacterium]|nr:hypothetical protein [Verrucomicrobiales bacterium]